MIWRSTSLILISFAVASLVLWGAPLLFGPLGLGEFVFVGQIGLTILALSLLDAAFARVPGSGSPPEP